MRLNLVDFHYLAAFSILIWELLINFDEDIQHIWLKPCSWITCLFVYVRYGTIILQGLIISKHFKGYTSNYAAEECYYWVILRCVLPFSLMICLQAILIGRVYALYERKGLILAILLSIYLPGVLVAGTHAFMYAFRSTMIDQHCAPSEMPYHWSYAAAVVLPVTLDITLIMLTVRRMYRLSADFFREPLLRTVLRDCLWGTLLVWLAALIPGSFSLSGDINRAYIITDSWLSTASYLVSTRIILNVRRLGFSIKKQKTSKSQPSATLADDYCSVVTSGVELDMTSIFRYRSDALLAVGDDEIADDVSEHAHA